MIEVTPADPGETQAARLIMASAREMASVYPPEENFAYSPAELRARGVRFFLVRRDNAAVGCAGLESADEYGELKSLFVAPEARGSGAADALMQRIEAEAARLGLKAIRLETGDAQHAAVRLYARRGYRRIPCWGAYAGSASSVCMEKRLS